MSIICFDDQSAWKGSQRNEICLYFVSSRSMQPSVIPGNGGSTANSTTGDQLMPICELEELSSSTRSPIIGSTSSKTLLKPHRANNPHIVEAESAPPRRVNDVSQGECQAAGILPVTSSYSSPSILNQQPLSLLSTVINNSSSDPLLCGTPLSSMTSVKQHRVVGLNVREDETAAQRRANDASPGECREAAVHSPSFYLPSTLNLSSNSSSSSSSDNGVSVA